VSEQSIVHSRGDHWVEAMLKLQKVEIFDSFYDCIDEGMCNTISNIFGSSEMPCTVKTLKHSGVDDCGLFAIADAASICFGREPTANEFDKSLVRYYI